MRQVLRKKSKWLGLAIMLALAAFGIFGVMNFERIAQGIEQSTRTAYNNTQEIDHATMNSVLDNPEWGDERDFIRLKDVETERVYTGAAEIEAGHEYEVQIYYRNDATEKYNGKDYDRVGVAREVYLATTYPSQLNAGQSGAVEARITAENTSPIWVQSSFELKALSDMTLHYVAASAKIQNNYKSNGSVLSRALFSEEGTMLGMDELNGMIFGGEKYAGKVVYRLKVIAAGDIAMSGKDPNDGGEITPVLPSELPKTGPVEWIFGAIIGILLVAGVFYACRSRRVVRKAARGKVKKRKK